MKTENIIFGIDLGTTYSCVAYIDEYEKPQTIKNQEGQITTPSVIWFDKDNNQLVGSDAKEYAISDPENSVSFIKREMGTDFRRNIQGVAYSPEELSSKILIKLVNDANNTLREQGVLEDGQPDVKKAVITCPAYFGLAEKEATKTAGELAGLEVVDIINEPTAAAVNYGVIAEGSQKRVLVFDLGGGTFDVTVIDIDGNKIDVVCTGGDPKLGGKDWDETIANFVVGKYQEENNTDEDIQEDLETAAVIMAAVEKAKKSLSSKDKAIINFSHQGNSFRYELTRDEFDAQTKFLLEKAIQLTDDCINTMNQKSPRQIDEILLVGGSSRMPQIKSTIEAKYGIKTSLHDPDEAVAKGAAIYASNVSAYNIVIEEIAKKTGVDADKIKAETRNDVDSLKSLAAKANVDATSLATTGKFEISNVSSRTYGIKVYDLQLNHDCIVNFIKQNDSLPAVKEEHFQTKDDNQSTVSLKLYETFGNDDSISELSKVEALEAVTEFVLTIEKPVPKGTGIIVKMTLNNSGLMTIYAEDEMYHSKLNAEYQVKNGMSDSEKAAAEERARYAVVQ